MNSRTETRPVRVLCVDDNHDSADSLAAVLAVAGYDARACYDGPSALVEARTFTPDVCLIDLNMPGMDGDELAKRLWRWATGRPLALVAVTAVNDEEGRNRIQMAGFNRHFVKPADVRELLAAIEELNA